MLQQPEAVDTGIASRQPRWVMGWQDPQPHQRRGERHSCIPKTRRVSGEAVRMLMGLVPYCPQGLPWALLPAQACAMCPGQTWGLSTAHLTQHSTASSMVQGSRFTPVLGFGRHGCHMAFSKSPQLFLILSSVCVWSVVAVSMKDCLLKPWSPRLVTAFHATELEINMTCY